jgi:hypothetical protein
MTAAAPLALSLAPGEPNTERAFLNWICSLNEEETEKLTFEEMIAYLNIMHKFVTHLRKALSTAD